MSFSPHLNGSFAVKKDEIIFYEGQKTQSLNILLQGKIDVFVSSSQNITSKKEVELIKKSFKIFSLDQNIFVGANDIYMTGKHSCSYRALEDCSIYAFIAQTPDQAKVLIDSQKDYGAYIINSLCALIENSFSALDKLKSSTNSLRILSENLVTFFWALKEKQGFQCTPSARFFREGLDRLQSLHENEISVPLIFNPQFMEVDYTGSTEDGDTGELSPGKQKADYYRHIYTLPADLRKNFFGTDMFITFYHCRDASQCLDEILTEIKDTFAKAEEYFKRLYSEDSECIYSAFIKAAGEVGMNGYDTSSILEAIDCIITKIRETVALYEKEYSHPCETDLDYIECSYNNTKASIKSSLDSKTPFAQAGAGISAGSESLPDELTNSARKILEYADIPGSHADSFLMNLIAFRNLRDRLSTDDEARNIRYGVTSEFYEIYESVFKKVHEQKNKSRLFNMFLTYGFMDEKLLTPEQTLTLYRLAGKDTTRGQSTVYNMKEWLTGIYEMEKDPSINEFGQDYYDVFREMKRRGEVTDKDKPQYDKDLDRRLKHEIGNMLATNHKLCHGQINVYFPLLHRDMITKDLSKALITPDTIKESLDRILDVDFSAFYREVHYRNPEKGIEKELVMKSIIPDFILVPIFGSRAVMWQEITGRNRSAPGRLLLPVFTDENLDDLLIRLVGNFRWELCRTMMGTAWNDTTQHSLTSEYTDYIQFFKKNRDLSEEAKDKIRAQSQKYHNKTRDIFTADYEIWVNNESKGNVRLNKVARNIMYKYCLFSKPIRDQLERQPMYAEIAGQLKMERTKIARELENRYSKYVKTGLALDADLEQNLKYYRDL